MAICESCGRDDPAVIKVQRMYLLADDDPDRAGTGETPQATPAAGDIEHWCASCCATFPHRVIDAE